LKEKECKLREIRALLRFGRSVMEKTELKTYLETTPGLGVLATADGLGKVDAALYARPHFAGDGTLVFAMADRLTHYNTLSNPHAAYLYIEEGHGYKGVRLFLTKIREEEAAGGRISEFSIPEYDQASAGEARFLVFYKLDRVLPLTR
jgi:hypothetical protein